MAEVLVRGVRIDCEVIDSSGTKGFPVSNDGFADPTSTSFKTTVEDGTVFRIVRYQPGVAPRNHRTDSIDYAVVISGTIEMELDDGVVMKLKSGDVLVQRGTIHNRVNRAAWQRKVRWTYRSLDNYGTPCAEARANPQPRIKQALTAPVKAEVTTTLYSMLGFFEREQPCGSGSCAEG